MNKTKFNTTVDWLLNRTKLELKDVEVFIHERNPWGHYLLGMFSIVVGRKEAGVYDLSVSSITREYEFPKFTKTVKQELESQLPKYRRWLEEYKKDKNYGK